MTFNLFGALIKPLRDADAAVGRSLLKRYLTGPQAIHDQAESDIKSLLEQINPSTVRADLLPYLKDIVGFTAELRSITDRLDIAHLRRLIQLAVPLWNERHTAVGMIDAIRLLTGRAAYLTTWFGFRSLLGEMTLTEDQLVSGGDSWVIGGDVTDYDQYWSNLRMMDDGTLDELMLIDVVKLMRPLSERLEIFLDDFLDRFNGELDKWTPLLGMPTIVDGTMLMPQDSAMRPIIPLCDPLGGDSNTGFINYNIVTKFRLESAGSILSTRWYLDDAIFIDDVGAVHKDGFELRLSPTSPKLVLNRWHGGAVTNLFSFDPVVLSIAPNTWYKLRISTNNEPSGGHRYIRVLIDDNPVLPSDPYIDPSSGGTPSGGPFLFVARGGAVSLDNVEEWRNPGRFATIKIGTPSEHDGAVSMTSNFVQ